MSKFSHVGKAVCVTLTAALLASCGGGGAEDKPAAAGSQTTDQSLHNALPATIREAGVMKVVISGPNPPWWETTPGKAGGYEGAGAELMDAVADVMGVKVEIVAIPDVSGAFAAISAQRYAFGFFPYADSVGGPRERPGAEFVDVLKEVVPFLVKSGNPKGIKSMDTLCGVTVAALVNAATYKVASAQAKKCQADGKDLTVLGVKSVPDGILAIKSGRADTFFTGGASLFYAAKTSNGEFEVVGQHAGNGFGQQFMGALLPKGSELAPLLLQGFQKLFDDGTYEKIMKKWGLDAEIIDKPGINLYSKWLAEHPSK